MDTIKDGAQCFDNWAYDILHGRVESILALEKQSKEQYPKAYKYVTGEDGEKSIGICNSTKADAYCFNACIPENNKKVFANVQVSFHDLRHIAEQYVISYKHRREELENSRLLAEQNLEEERKKYAESSASHKSSPPNISSSNSNSEQENTTPEDATPSEKTKAEIVSFVDTVLYLNGEAKKTQKNAIFIPVICQEKKPAYVVLQPDFQNLLGKRLDLLLQKITIGKLRIVASGKKKQQDNESIYFYLSDIK